MEINVSTKKKKKIILSILPQFMVNEGFKYFKVSKIRNHIFSAYMA